MKQIAFLRKKDGLARAEFIRLYEEEHAKLIARLLPFFAQYRRGYPIDGEQGDDAAFAHDAIMEMWFASPDRQAAMASRIAEPAIGEEMRRDEERLFDRPAMVMFTVDEHGAPAAAPRKTFLLARKRPDIPREAMIRQYEETVAPALLSALEAHGLRAPRSFCRNYPVPGGTFRMPHLDTAAYPADFDAIIEIGFREAPDHQAFRRLLKGGPVADLLAGGASGMLDPAHLIHLDVEEYSSAPL